MEGVQRPPVFRYFGFLSLLLGACRGLASWIWPGKSKVKVKSQKSKVKSQSQKSKSSSSSSAGDLSGSRVGVTCVTCVTFVGALIVELGCEENKLLHAMGREETDLVRTCASLGTTGATGWSGPMERFPLDAGLGDAGSGGPPKPAWRTTVAMGCTGCTGCSSGWDDAQPIFQIERVGFFATFRVEPHTSSHRFPHRYRYCTVLYR